MYLRKILIIVLIAFLNSGFLFAQSNSAKDTVETKNITKEDDLIEREKRIKEKEKELEEREKKATEKEKNEPNSNVNKSENSENSESADNSPKHSVYISGIKGKTKAEYEEGELSAVKAGYFYRLTPNLRLGGGVSSGNFYLQSDSRSSSLLISALALNQGSNGGYGAANFLLFMTGIFDATYKDIYRYNVINLDFNFHPLKNSNFDPYIGGGIIGGSCGDLIFNCTLFGFGLRGGLQYNFSNVFLFAQGEIQALRVTSEFGQTIIQNKLPSIGVGIRF